VLPGNSDEGLTLCIRNANRGEEVRAKVWSLHAASKNQAKETIDWFYGALNVLDSKAGGLLTFNGIFIALLAAYFGGNSGTGEAMWIRVVAGVALLLLGVSSILCLMVRQVSWDFLHHAKKKGDNSNEYDFEPEISELAIVAYDRREYFGCAVNITRLSLVPLGIGIMAFFV